MPCRYGDAYLAGVDDEGEPKLDRSRCQNDSSRRASPSASAGSPSLHAGANVTGAGERFREIVGTAAFKVLDLQAGRTGLNLHEAQALGLDAIRSESRHRTRGHGYPGSAPVTTVLTIEKGSRRLLGAQQIASEGVQRRINVYATCLTAGMTLDEISSLDLAYAPPLAPVHDPILISATVGLKDLETR